MSVSPGARARAANDGSAGLASVQKKLATWREKKRMHRAVSEVINPNAENTPPRLNQNQSRASTVEKVRVSQPPSTLVAKTPTVRGGSKCRAKELVAEATEFERNGQLRAALRAFRSALALVPNHQHLQSRIASLSERVCEIEETAGHSSPSQTRTHTQAGSLLLSPADLLHSALKSANKVRDPSEYETSFATSNSASVTAVIAAATVAAATSSASPSADVCAKGRAALLEAYDEEKGVESDADVNTYHDDESRPSDDHELEGAFEDEPPTVRGTQARTRVRRSLTPPTPPTFTSAEVKPETSSSPEAAMATTAEATDSRARRALAKARVQRVDVNGEIRNLLERQVVDILNKGDEAALLELHGIGVKRALYIMEHRKNARFHQLSDLKHIGLSEKQVARIARDMVGAQLLVDGRQT